MLAGAGVMITAVPAMGANPQYLQEPVVSTLFSDNFTSSSDLTTNWNVSTNTVGRTEFGQTPTIVTGGVGSPTTYAQFKLDTYNPSSSTLLLGTQLSTKQTFALPTGANAGQGIQFQITARVETTGLAGPAGNGGDTSTPVTQGLNAASFAYGFSTPSNYLDEIDIENLTEQQTPPTVGNPTGATGASNSYFTTSNGDASLFTSYKTTSTGSADNSFYAQTPYAPKDTGSTATPISIYAWHTYDIDWFPTQIDWYIDGQLVREEAPGETSTTNPTLYIPNQPMAYMLNFWGPASTFSDAYSSTLTNAATTSANKEYYYDTAYASVSTIQPAGSVPEPVTFGFAAFVGYATLCRRNANRNRQSTR